MAYDPILSQRLSKAVAHLSDIEPKSMFGGIAWLLNGNMCVGVHEKRLILRIGVEQAALALEQKHVNPMDFTGKPMKGWVMVDAAGVEKDTDMKRFVAMAVDFVSKLPQK